MDRKKLIKLLTGFAAVLVCGVLYFVNSAGAAPDTVVTEGFSDTAGQKQEQADGLQEEKTEDTAVYIHVCGQVKRPGVYVFDGEPRVIEAVEKAGGFTKKADGSKLNQAAVVPDGTQLMIPAKQKNANSTAVTSNANRNAISSDKVNINTASKEELMTLSGIGESKASQILSYREENGLFHKIEDIMNISGIKEGVFGRIKDRITV